MLLQTLKGFLILRRRAVAETGFLSLDFLAEFLRQLSSTLVDFQRIMPEDQGLLSDHLVSPVAQKSFGRPVETGDDTIGIAGEDPVSGAVHERLLKKRQLP